jgi:tetratricopeptide (TPR) repeat protein
VPQRLQYLLTAAFVTAACVWHDAARAQDLELGARIDSISSSTDTASLRRIADPAVRIEGDDAAATIARGFAAMRLFTITGDEERAKTARVAFEVARDIEPGEALVWYGLGLTWASGPELAAEPPRFVAVHAFAEALGSDPRSRAIRALERSLELDPDLVPAAVALVAVAIRKRDHDALRLARNTLAAAHEQGRFRLDALDALARAERALGNEQPAVDAARRAAVMSGGEPSAMYELALALFAAGEDGAGARAWFDAVDTIDPDLADRVHEDLRAIADDWEEDRWSRLDRDGRRDWLRDFWDTRAALAGEPVADRIGEHYRRLDVARARYWNRRRWGAPPSNALLLERPDLPFDDRGIIYVRHGEPFDIIRSGDAGTVAGPGLPNESWVYRTPEGNFRVLHFFNYGSAERAPGVAGNPGASAADGGFGDAYNEFVLVHILPCGGWAGDRARYDRRLSLMRCNEFDRRSISAEVRRDAWTALRTDSDAPDYARELDFVFDLFTFRGERDRTDVVAGIVLPADAIEPAPAWQGVAWDLDASLIVADTFFDRVARVDTTLRLQRPAAPPPGQLLRLSLTLPVTPGESQAQRLVIADNADPLHGRLAGRELDIPDYSGRDLMMSDIVMAEPGPGGTFRRGDITLSLVPTREFPGGAFQVFYEIYNLADDTGYTTEIVVEKAGRGVGGFLRGLFGGGPEVRLRFDGTASHRDALSRELRRVDTSLGTGDYRIRVRVTDHSSGRSVEREREFTVVR